MLLRKRKTSNKIKKFEKHGACTVCAVPRMAMEDEHLKNWAGEHEGEL